ncbi:hypothetical protein EWM64_g1310 [Hericium alpestre]|uniref:RNA polymerase I-specific transcription initiation factor RRN3 n=1 Tax=Hericium alpestre TaxID=135208 RepID=A0A4Z0A8U7_9AGAM|nr:hypothetical protein EWM64_g1310 [Hericium alpestre]
MDSNFVKSYTSFIGILVSARPEYLSLVLGKVAQSFTYQSGLQALEAGLPESSSAPLTRRVVYDRIHYLLRHLLSLVPTLPSTLQPLLYRNFPHKRQNRAYQVAYIRNMLRVMEYCPEIADKLLSSIIDRAIQIDVEIQVELEELEAVEAIQEQAELFELDPFDTVVGQEESADDSGSDDDPDIGDNFSDLSSEAGEVEEDDPKTVDAPLDVDHIHDMVGKLDSILKLIFDHFSRANTTLPPDRPLSGPISRTDSPLPPPDAFGNTGSPNLVSAENSKDQLRTQFHTLLAIFDRTILRTFKSRYTQFLLFWYASLDPEFSDTFQGELVSKALLEADQPVVTRAAAASYIAGFVSRATFVDRECARSVVRILCQFLRSQLDLYETLGSSVPRHAAGLAPLNVIYAVAQAVFLIFCFRWRDLMEDEDEEVDEFSSSPSHGSKNKWMDALAIVQRIVNSALNPLKFCSENVVFQFARVAQATGFVYVYPIIEANRRFDFTPSASSTPHANGASTSSVHSPIFGNNMLGELNTFFPFDPYKLPKTSSYIEGVYREWSAVAIDDEEEEEDEEGDQGVSAMPGRPISGAPSSQDRETETLGASFGGMSITSRVCARGWPDIGTYMILHVGERTVRRVTYQTTLPVATIVERIDKATNRSKAEGHSLPTLAEMKTREDVEALMDQAVGDTFAFFVEQNHGNWLQAIFGPQSPEVHAYSIGNVLIAQTLLKHDPVAGLYVPPKLLVTGPRSADGPGAKVIYDVPSTLILMDENVELQKAAEALDEKLDEFIRRMISV